MSGEKGGMTTEVAGSAESSVFVLKDGNEGLVWATRSKEEFRERACSSLHRHAKAKAIRETVFRVMREIGAEAMGSSGGSSRPLRTSGGSQAGRPCAAQDARLRRVERGQTTGYIPAASSTE